MWQTKPEGEQKEEREQAYLLKAERSRPEQGQPDRCEPEGGILNEAKLNRADFFATEKQGEDIVLIRADLIRADLTKATLQEADLAECLLKEATLTDAKLQGADLSSAVLQNVNLTNAVLTDANLTDAYLSDADLSEARGWTVEQLRAARSLEGATMPNDQKYKDWLKSKDRKRGWVEPISSASDRPRPLARWGENPMNNKTRAP